MTLREETRRVGRPPGPVSLGGKYVHHLIHIAFSRYLQLERGHMAASRIHANEGQILERLSIYSLHSCTNQIRIP